jgi:hypothetical protein
MQSDKLLAEAAQQLDALFLEAVGEDELGKWRGQERMTNRAWNKNQLRAELRHIITGDNAVKDI